MATSFLNRMPRLGGGDPSWAPLLVGALFLGAGAIAGLVIATGNLIFIALVLGAIAGLLLLNALPVAVWLILGGVFLINGPVGYFWPSMAKVSWLFSLLGVFMAGAALLYVAVGKEKFQRPLPPFIYTGLGFIVLAVISAFLSDGGLNEIVAGIKRYFQFWGVMFLLAVVPFTERTVRNWMLFLVGVAVVQLPFTLYQRVVLVPSVLSYDKPGFVPFDIIVGSFEGSITGGGASSIMAMFQVLMLFAVFCAWREKLLSGFWALVLSVLMLLPLGLGETKVVLVLFPIVLFSAYFDLVAKKPLAFLGIVVATLIVGAILGYFYFVVQVAGDLADVSLAENLRDTMEYNFGDRGYYATGVNRLTAVPYWFESQSWNNPIQTLLGTGIGSAYGIDGLVPDPGHMFVAHPGMHIDLLTTSTVLWEFGVVGFIVYFAMLFGAMRTVAKCFHEANTAWDRVFCRLLMSSLATTLLMAVYTNSAIVLVSHAFIVSLTLGLVAWRYRHGPLSPTRADRIHANKSRFNDRFRDAKVIFPTDGLLTPTIIGAYRERRRLAHSARTAAAQQGANQAGETQADRSDAGEQPASPAASAEAPAQAEKAEQTEKVDPFAGTVAAGQTARSAFPKGDLPGTTETTDKPADRPADQPATSPAPEAAADARADADPGTAAPAPAKAQEAGAHAPDAAPRSAFSKADVAALNQQLSSGAQGMAASRNVAAADSRQTVASPSKSDAATTPAALGRTARSAFPKKNAADLKAWPATQTVVPQEHQQKAPAPQAPSSPTVNAAAPAAEPGSESAVEQMRQQMQILAAAGQSARSAFPKKDAPTAQPAPAQPQAEPATSSTEAQAPAAPAAQPTPAQPQSGSATQSVEAQTPAAPAAEPAPVQPQSGSVTPSAEAQTPVAPAAQPTVAQPQPTPTSQPAKASQQSEAAEEPAVAQQQPAASAQPASAEQPAALAQPHSESVTPSTQAQTPAVPAAQPVAVQPQPAPASQPAEASQQSVAAEEPAVAQQQPAASAQPASAAQHAPAQPQIESATQSPAAPMPAAPATQPLVAQPQPTPASQPADASQQPAPAVPPTAAVPPQSASSAPAVTQPQPASAALHAAVQQPSAPAAQPAAARSQSAPSVQPAAAQPQPAPATQPAAAQPPSAPAVQPAATQSQPAPAAQPAATRPLPTPAAPPAATLRQPVSNSPFVSDVPKSSVDMLDVGGPVKSAPASDDNRWTPPKAGQAKGASSSLDSKPAADAASDATQRSHVVDPVAGVDVGAVARSAFATDVPVKGPSPAGRAASSPEVGSRAQQQPSRAQQSGTAQPGTSGKDRSTGVSDETRYPREPRIDLNNGPHTRPMFADDDEPLNVRNTPPSSLWWGKSRKR